VKVLAIHSTCVYCEVPAVVKCIGCLQNVVVLNVQVMIGNEDFLIHFVNSTCCVFLQAGCYCRDKPPPLHGYSAQWCLTAPEMTCALNRVRWLYPVFKSCKNVVRSGRHETDSRMFVVHDFNAGDAAQSREAATLC
jgi:hypothetical protein